MSVQIDNRHVRAHGVGDRIGVGRPSARDELNASSGESFPYNSLNLGARLGGLSSGYDGECVHALTISAGILGVNMPAKSLLGRAAA